MFAENTLYGNTDYVNDWSFYSRRMREKEYN